MPQTGSVQAAAFENVRSTQSASMTTDTISRKPPQRAITLTPFSSDPLLTADDVAHRLNVSKDWVWDHSSRKRPHLPVIRMGDGTLRYRASSIEDFIRERERISALRSGHR
jgi:hypothetical protein